MSATTAPKFGLEPVLRDVDSIISALDLQTGADKVPTVSSLPMPNTDLARSIQKKAEIELSPEAYNHSMRVYYIGMAVLLKYFRSEWKSLWEDPTTYFLSCLLHDIGTTDKNIRATKMSFEYYGGFLARHMVVDLAGGDPEMGDSIAETIIRHQDVGKRGMLSANTQLIQIATLFDNVGGHQQLLDSETVDSIYKEFPRGLWSGCFANVIRTECGLKPYCSTTRLGEEEFIAGVLLKNPLNRLES